MHRLGWGLEKGYDIFANHTEHNQNIVQHFKCYSLFPDFDDLVWDPNT